MIKQDLLQGLKNIDDKLLVSKAIDKAAQCMRSGRESFTSFYDPYQKVVLGRVIKKINEVYHFFYGGYEGAEREILVFCPEFTDITEVPLPLRMVEISGNSDFDSLTHRDFLGSLMGLGITREKIGDIIVDKGLVRVVVMEEVADYIASYLDKVGNSKVHVESKELCQVEKPEQEAREIRTTVASLRLDAIAGSGYGLSRSKAVELVESGRVSVNWEQTETPSKSLKEGDVISVRGKGRIILEKVGHTTKKDRITVTIKKLI